jgi:Dirigent-like protein
VHHQNSTQPRNRSTRPRGAQFAVVAIIGLAACSSDSGTAQANTEVLRFYSTANFDAEVYVRANGAPAPTSQNDVAAPGDLTILQDDLFAIKEGSNEPTGSQVGSARGQCTFLSVADPNLTSLHADALCNGVVALDGGTLLLDASVTVDFSKPAVDHYAITGGTGKYAGAHGTADVTTLPSTDDTEAAIYELHITR